MNRLKFLPQFLRLKLIRHNIDVPQAPEGFQVNIASTQEELEKAYALLHDCYVGTKLMAADASGLRCNFYSFMPNTTTVVAKIGSNVVGTLALIKDSSTGLPSDKDFREENDRLRRDGHRLVEVSSLAIDAQYRKKAHIVSLFLMKYLQHYTTHYMGCTTVTCVVHPKARDFYAAFWGFKANKKIIEYKYVNGALGSHVYGDITDPTMKSLMNKFPKSKNKNPIDFLFNYDQCLVYPKRNIENHLDPIFTPQLLKYFLAERTDAIRSLTRFELSKIYSAYSLFFDNLHQTELFKNFGHKNLRKKHYRYPAKIAAKLVHDSGTEVIGYIMDLSQDGAFFATNSAIDPTAQYKIEFYLGHDRYITTALMRWQNPDIRNHNLVGYGIQFGQSLLGISRALKATHLSVARVDGDTKRYKSIA